LLPKAQIIKYVGEGSIIREYHKERSIVRATDPEVLLN
jgi:hypothetical protein